MDFVPFKFFCLRMKRSKTGGLCSQQKPEHSEASIPQVSSNKHWQCNLRHLKDALLPDPKG